MKHFQKNPDQSGINMVDLMMWLVIAALLLAAALQGIGFYQRAAFLYQLENDTHAAGQNIITQATLNNGTVTTDIADKGLAETKITNPNTRFTKTVGPDGYFTVVANNINVQGTKAIYSSDARNGLKAGVNIVPSDAVFTGVGSSESDATIAVNGICPAGTYTAQYYATIDLTGAPKATLCENAVTKNWGTGAPDVSGVPADNFSVRWTKTFNVTTAGNYKFDTTSDDGIRVILDGTTIIDKWVPQSSVAWSATVPVSAGTHTVVVEYYERNGYAVESFSYAPVP